MARHWQDACVDAVAKLPPLRARRFSETIRVEFGAFLSIRAATTHPDSSTRWRTGAVAVSSLRRALGTWLACRWWRRDGKALAGCVRRCCREAAAPPGTPFLGNDPGGVGRLPLNPRSDDSSRLVDEVAHRCGCGVIAPPAPLGPGW